MMDRSHSVLVNNPIRLLALVGKPRFSGLLKFCHPDSKQQQHSANHSLRPSTVFFHRGYQGILPGPAYTSGSRSSIEVSGDTSERPFIRAMCVVRGCPIPAIGVTSREVMASHLRH